MKAPETCRVSIIDRLPTKGRLFTKLSPDSAVTSTRYEQLRRQRQGREERYAASEGKTYADLEVFCLHDQRHAFAITSPFGYPTCIYRLSEHLGHSSVKTTEVYLRFLKVQGLQGRYARRADLFGSLKYEGAIT